MKSLVLALSTLCLFSCQKEKADAVMVVKNCTGVYLRIDGKDHQVCNERKLASYNDGDVVDAAYELLNDCNGDAMEGVRCAMAWPNYGWIKIKRVR